MTSCNLRQYRVASILLACSVVTVGISLADPIGNVSQDRVLAETGAGENWFLNGGNFRGEHFSPLSQINEDSISSLGLAWWVDLPAPDGISATAIVVDGIIFLSGPQSIVFAIDAATGKRRWIYDPDLRKGLAANPYLSWRGRANRGVAVWEGKVFVGVADCRLIALDAATGREIWSTISCDPALGYGISDAPRVGNGKVFVGNSGSESEKKNRGYVSAYDAHTGKLAWRFFTVPSSDPAENRSPAMRMAAKTWSGDALQNYGGGGSAWNEMTYDPQSNLLIFGTAGALPYVYHERNPDGGDNLFTSSVIAINASSGEYAWHYQTVPQDSWDYNANMNIVLADLELNGEVRKVALIAPKNGFFYVLDRTDGELISAGKYARANWATHINLETGRPELDPAARYWEAPAGETTAVWPNMWGAHSWQPMAWHPGHRLAYIPVTDMPQLVTMLEDGDFIDALEVVGVVDDRSHATGKLVAWDPVAQAARWSIDHKLPVNGGVLATAGDLVFQGNAMGEFVAYSAASGRLLWSVSTRTGISAAPVSYLLDNDQYVLVAAGVGGIMQFFYPALHSGKDVIGPSRLFAFKLGSTEAFPGISPDNRRLADLPSPDADNATLELGASLYLDHCLGCHGEYVIARYGGSVPDLRFSAAEIHEAWHGIVIGGALAAQGMPSFELLPEESSAIQAYVIAQANRLGAR
jgi:quinohemoprotein ethanol dehydrogenase